LHTQEHVKTNVLLFVSQNINKHKHVDKWKMSSIILANINFVQTATVFVNKNSCI